MQFRRSGATNGSAQFHLEAQPHVRWREGVREETVPQQEPQRARLAGDFQSLSQRDTQPDGNERVNALAEQLAG